MILKATSAAWKASEALGCEHLSGCTHRLSFRNMRRAAAASTSASTPSTWSPRDVGFVNLFCAAMVLFVWQLCRLLVACSLDRQVLVCGVDDDYCLGDTPGWLRRQGQCMCQMVRGAEVHEGVSANVFQLCSRVAGQRAKSAREGTS